MRYDLDQKSIFTMVFGLRYSALALTIGKGVFAAQPSAASPVSAPIRGLPWGQLNFLHTTDTHGWHAGHLQECDQTFPQLLQSIR